MMFGRGYGGYGGCFGSGNWHYFVMGGLLLIGLALIIWAMNKSKKGADTQVLDLLKEKYVLGEITEEEYIKRKNTLERK